MALHDKPLGIYLLILVNANVIGPSEAEWNQTIELAELYARLG